MMTTDSERGYNQSSSSAAFFSEEAADDRPFEGYYITQAERRFQELNMEIQDEFVQQQDDDDVLCQEVAQLRGNVSRLERLLMASLGVVMFLSSLSFGSSMAVWRALAKTDSGNTKPDMVSTWIGGGGAPMAPLELEILMPTSKEEGPFPYACNVSFEDAVNLWRSVLQGQSANVILGHAQEDTTMQQSMGVSLSFQGATLNNTHACLPTLNREHPHHALCIDFVTPRCVDTTKEGLNLGDKEEEASSNSNEREHDHRRELFQSLVQQNDESFNPHEDAGCEFGVFCEHHFASIVLVGHSG